MVIELGTIRFSLAVRALARGDIKEAPCPEVPNHSFRLLGGLGSGRSACGRSRFTGLGSSHAWLEGKDDAVDLHAFIRTADTHRLSHSRAAQKPNFVAIL
jgi:hypothetical protein